MERIGIIYKIVNKVNKKIYIGKTKEFYGNQKFGLEGRFRQHLINAFTKSKKNDCPRFYNAIRKYGKRNFICTLLAKCKLGMCDDLETEYIKIFNTIDPKYGYNISTGGLGRSVVFVSEEIRMKISNNNNKINKLDKNSNLLNIKSVYKNGKLVGYTVRRRERGKQYQKWFTSTENTPEVNYNLAIEWLENLKNHTLNNNMYNKSSKLPKNINCVKKNGEVIGYRVDIMINKKKITKNVQDKNLTLEQLLEKAINIKKSILDKSKNY